MDKSLFNGSIAVGKALSKVRLEQKMLFAARRKKKKGLPSEIERSPIKSDILNEVRTFFEGEEGKNS